MIAGTFGGKYSMDAKNSLAVGAALLPALVANAVCKELDSEIHKDAWRQAAPAQHHTADQEPSAPLALADNFGATVGGIPPIHIDIPSVPFALENGSGYILLENGGCLLTEGQHLVATS